MIRWGRSPRGRWNAETPVGEKTGCDVRGQILWVGFECDDGRRMFGSATQCRWVYVVGEEDDPARSVGYHFVEAAVS